MTHIWTREEHRGYRFYTFEGTKSWYPSPTSILKIPKDHDLAAYKEAQAAKREELILEKAKALVPEVADKIQEKIDASKERLQKTADIGNAIEKAVMDYLAGGERSRKFGTRRNG